MEPQQDTYVWHGWNTGLHLGYLIFDAETVKRTFTDSEIEHWTEWAVRGKA